MKVLAVNRLRTDPGRKPGSERAVVVMIGVLLLFEAALYSAVTPLLPHYARVLHASKPAVGVLAAAYPAGLIPGSFLGGWMTIRAGVRGTTLAGLLGFAVFITAFGFGSELITLDALRFFQGVACGCIWGGGLTWVLAVAAPERRGEVLGWAIGAAIFGTLLGPLLGTLAVTAGTEIVFSFVGALSLALAGWTFHHPDPPPEPKTRTSLRALAGSPRVLLGFWLIVLEAGTIGAAGTLLSLRLSHFGASGVEIGAVFLAAALLSTVIAPFVGRSIDRRGAGVPLAWGLTATAVLLGALPLPQTALPLAILTAVTIGPPLTAYSVSAMAVMTTSVEGTGIALAVATTLVNLAWAAGETIGAPAAATISQATSDAVPLIALAAMMVVTLGLVRRVGVGSPRRAAATGPLDRRRSPAA